MLSPRTCSPRASNTFSTIIERSTFKFSFIFKSFSVTLQDWWFDNLNILLRRRQVDGRRFHHPLIEKWSANMKAFIRLQVLPMPSRFCCIFYSSSVFVVVVVAGSHYSSRFLSTLNLLAFLSSNCDCDAIEIKIIPWFVTFLSLVWVVAFFIIISMSVHPVLVRARTSWFKWPRRRRKKKISGDGILGFIVVFLSSVITFLCQIWFECGASQCCCCCIVTENQFKGPPLIVVIVVCFERDPLNWLELLTKGALNYDGPCLRLFYCTACRIFMSTSPSPNTS